MASTALLGTVFAFWLFFPCISINYCNYRVNHREFLWLVVASQCQMSSDINILYHNWFILPGTGQTTPRMVKAQAVRILLECILVLYLRLWSNLYSVHFTESSFPAIHKVGKWWHFCTTSDEDKLKVFTNRINFTANLHLPWCFELKLSWQIPISL